MDTYDRCLACHPPCCECRGLAALGFAVSGRQAHYVSVEMDDASRQARARRVVAPWRQDGSVLCPNDRLVCKFYGVDIVVDRANTWSITATMAQVRSLRDCMAYEVDDGEMLHSFQIDSTDDVQAFLDTITSKRTWSAAPSLRNFCRMH
ncbi:unnamed protein product [Aphanomyces euteiches]|nr:hypothetical protein AeRB84_006837 [Aphanomyces euteiches]